jgi:O-antigen/teichoic acid export membrane protein
MASTVLSRVAGLAVLTAAGQLLIIGTLPVYSRIFDPATYGEYVIFVGVFTVVSVLAGVRYDTAIVLPRRALMAAALSWLVMLIALFVTILILFITLAVPLLQSVGGRGPKLTGDFGYGLAAATLIGAAQRCFASWCVRRGRFLRIGWAQFVLCVVTVLAQLSFAHLMNARPALIWGFVCAVLAQTLCLSVGTDVLASFAWRRGSALRALSVSARKYRRFPTYMVGYALASTARDRLIQLVLGLGAGAATVGRFGLAYRVVFAPNSLVYSAVSPVFYGVASRESRQIVGGFAAGAVETLFVLLVVPYVAFAIEAPVLTDTVLSARWAGTGPYLTALAGPALLLAATCWLDRAFDSFRRQHIAFALEASFTLTAVALVGCLVRVVNPITVTWAFAALALVYYWIYFRVTFLACGFERSPFRRACLTGLSMLVVALVLGILVHVTLPPLWRLPGYVVTAATVWALWLNFCSGVQTLRMLTRVRVHGMSD